MLPDFPSLKRERYSQQLRAAQRLSDAKHPVLSEIRRTVQREGRKVEHRDMTHQVSMDEYQKFEAGIEIDLRQIAEFDDQRWIATLRKMTDTFADKMMERMIHALSDASARVGNTVAQDDGDLNGDAILRMLEKVHIEFDPVTKMPIMVLLTGTQQAEKLRELNDSPEFTDRYRDVIDRKRIEWRLQSIDRRLVD